MSSLSQKIGSILLLTSVMAFPNLQAHAQNPTLDKEEKDMGHFTLQGELAVKVIYSHGQKGLLGPDQKGTVGPGQRARLNFGYEKNNIGVFIQAEEGRIWGETGGDQKSVSTMTFSQAYFYATFAERFGIQVGRMPLLYEDQRLLSYSTWDLIPKTHDVLKLKFNSLDKRTQVDIGATVTNNSAYTFLNPYNLDDYFKYMVFVYASHEFCKDFRWSILGVTDFQEKRWTDSLGNERVDPTTLYARTTWGTYFHIAKSRQLSASISAFGQFGKLDNGNLVVAGVASATLSYKPIKNLDIELAYDFISGNDPKSKIRYDHAFDRLLGSSHSFLGIMDFFKPEGPDDFTLGQGFHQPYLSLTYRPAKSHSINLTGRYFWSMYNYDVVFGPNDIRSSNDLGFEASLIYKYQILKDLSLEFGYAFHTSTPALEQLSEIAIGKSKFAHFGYLTLAYKPIFYDSAKHKR